MKSLVRDAKNRFFYDGAEVSRLRDDEDEYDEDNDIEPIELCMLIIHSQTNTHYHLIILSL